MSVSPEYRGVECGGLISSYLIPTINELFKNVANSMSVTIVTMINMMMWIKGLK